MGKKYQFENKVIEIDLFGTKYSVKLIKESYIEGNVAIQGVILDKDTNEPVELFGTLSVNMPGYVLQEDEICIKSYSENVGFANAARKSGFFTDTAKRISSGFVEIEIWRMITKD